MGILKSAVPGMGTPIKTPTTVLITKINEPSFSENQKDFDQGAFSANFKTEIAATAIANPATHALLVTTTAPTISRDQIHQVSGCSDLTSSYYFLREPGVEISTPHSFAG